MSEKYALQVSWPTDMSPTAIFFLATARCGTVTSPGGMRWWGGGVPGVVGYGVAGRVLYRVPTRTIPGTIFSLFLALGPTYGQMKLNLVVL